MFTYHADVLKNNKNQSNFISRTASVIIDTVVENKFYL